jgi:methylated-DNA-protein-cysteine methyltransferase-like protein
MASSRGSRPRRASKPPAPKPKSRRAAPAAGDEDDATHVQRLYRTIYAVVRRIPRGRVATYAQVGLLAGLPRGGRVVGRALKVSGRVVRLPWQRVIGKRGPGTGKISIHDPVGAAIQRKLLEAEGVAVGDTGSISLARYGWRPAARLRVVEP